MKWIRGLWAKHTERKTLNPEMRNMLTSLDGVYEQRPAPDAPHEHDDERDEAKA